MFRQKLRDFFIILESLRHDNKKSNRSLASLARVMYLAAVFLRMFLLLTSITKYCQSEIAIVLGSLPLYCWSYRLSNLAPVLQNKSLLFRLVYILGLVKQCVVNLPIGQFPLKDYMLLLEYQLAIFLRATFSVYGVSQSETFRYTGQIQSLEKSTIPRVG